MNPLCELRNVTKTFRDGDHSADALHEVDLSVAPGSFTALMGPSGSGKSTLLNLAGGLDEPTSGRVMVDGTDLAALDPRELADVRRTTVGYVFQALNLVPTLTIVENVMLPLELGGTSARRARSAAREALESTGVGHVADRYPDDCSGGECQRASIARAVVGERRLVLADEPTGALDTSTGEKVMELLARQVDGGRAVVLVTHEPRFASWADRIVRLRDGKVVGVTESLPEELGDLRAQPAEVR